MPPASRQAYPKIFCETAIQLFREAMETVRGDGSTWVWDLGLGSNHNSGFYCTTLLASISQSQSEEY